MEMPELTQEEMNEMRERDDDLLLAIEQEEYEAWERTGQAILAMID
jgi:hypothetical protein